MVRMVVEYSFFISNRKPFSSNKMEMKGSKREEVRRNEERVLREAEERRRKTVPEEVKQEKREERERKTDKMRPHVGKENTFFVAAIIPPEKRPVVSNVIREGRSLKFSNLFICMPH